MTPNHENGAKKGVENGFNQSGLIIKKSLRLKPEAFNTTLF
jgi:hypothetical protein